VARVGRKVWHATWRHGEHPQPLGLQVPDVQRLPAQMNRHAPYPDTQHPPFPAQPIDVASPEGAAAQRAQQFAPGSPRVLRG